MLELRGQGWKWAGWVLAAGLLAGCASGSRAPAPVEDRSPGARSQPALVADPTKVLPGAENAGKPGYHTVRPGDTLIRISLDTGQNWRDIARWNNIDNPNVIEVGQVLRVIPPVGSVPEVAGARPATPAASAPVAGTPPAVASTPRGTATGPVASLPPANNL